MVEHRTVNRGDSGSISPTTILKLLSFTQHSPVSFGRDTKSRWSFLSGVYARGSKRSHTGGKCVTSLILEKENSKTKHNDTLATNMWLTQSDELSIRRRNWVG